MTKEEILENLQRLNNKLSERELYGEILIYGGSALCLTTEFRESTNDISALFHPKMEIYDISKEMEIEYGLPEGWLNDGVNGFVSVNVTDDIYMKLSNLIISVASLKYILVMKFMSCRSRTTKDKEDIKNLLLELKIDNYEDVEKILLSFYDEKMINIRNKYFVMEIIDELKGLS